MTSREIRESFLKYFEQNGHRIVPSSPLVPHDDPTLLFTNAGMNQFKDVFLGRERRSYTRATSSQKCMRVSGKHNDLENVGPSLRHHTFFEMLGNFSFGDYFKADAIPFAWRLLTDEWKLPPETLWATVFEGDAGVPRDDEAYDIWRKFLPVERIGELGVADNFWQMGDTGPCGRCSEIYYFRGPSVACEEETAGRVCRGLECSCDRFVEIWNNVFMEFDRQADGTLNPLPARSIDTGMGLERVTAVVQGRLATYDTDLFTPILQKLEEITHATYGPLHLGIVSTDSDVSMRVIADHIRATTFLICDGVVPSNEWRGYVLRKIMRRAMRHGKHLGMHQPFLHRLVDVLVHEMGDAYPELRASREMIQRTIVAEEDRFDAVLNDGLPRLEGEIALAIRADSRTLPGEKAFRLYDTFGLPLDFIEDIAQSQGVTVDHEGFERAMEVQRRTAREGSAFKSAVKETAWAPRDDDARLLEEIGDTFTGYGETSTQGARIVALFDAKGRGADELPAGAHGYVALTKTPFYLEAGGQVSDSGRIFGAGSEAIVEGIVRVGRWPRLHRVLVQSGSLHAGEIVTAEVDDEVRDATRRNHTATHLLHAALRQVLGGHVKQAGSLVAPDRLRFDFVHFSGVTREQLDEIERIVNAQIYRNTPVQTDIRSTDEAIAAGAMALFGEKYGDRVRVVSVPGFSMELCGGTHVRATGDIGLFAIVSEGGVAAGTRRIEAITGADAVRRYQQQHAALDRIVEAAGVAADQAPQVIERLQKDVKRLTREVSQLKMKAALAASVPPGSLELTGQAAVVTEDGGLADIATIGDVKAVLRRVEGLDKDALRGLADSLKDRLKSGVIVLAAPNDTKVSIVVSVSKDLTPRIHAGTIVKTIAPIVGGAGGGRPDFAEAGGRDASKIEAMLAEGRKVIEQMAEGHRP